MIDVLAAASVQAAIRQDFPDHFAQYKFRERRRSPLALHEALSLYLNRWQRLSREQHPGYPMMLPPL